MQTLAVEIIYANSPQAKGRIEHGDRTHQDRLVDFDSLHIFWKDLELSFEILDYKPEPKPQTILHPAKLIHGDVLGWVKLVRLSNNLFNSWVSSLRATSSVRYPKFFMILHLIYRTLIHSDSSTESYILTI